MVLCPGQIACAKRGQSNTPAEWLLTGLIACRMAQELAALARVPSLASAGEGACSMAIPPPAASGLSALPGLSLVICLDASSLLAPAASWARHV